MGESSNYSTAFVPARRASNLGKTALNKVTPLQLSILFKTLQRDEKLSATYVRMIHRVLRAAFNTAIRWGFFKYLSSRVDNGGDNVTFLHF